MTKSTQPKARLERWVFYKTGLILRSQDQTTQAKFKAEYHEARHRAGPATGPTTEMQPHKDPS